MQNTKIYEKIIKIISKYIFYMIKKVFLIVSLIFLHWIWICFADSWTSTVTYTSSSWARECWTSFNHSVTHYWIPNSNNWNAPISWTINCTTHAYYASSDHSKAFTYNNWWITACPAWERVVGWNGSNSMTCRKYDDIPPTISDVTNNNPINLLADDNYSYTITIDDHWQAPIVKIEWWLERYDINNFIASFTDTSSPWTRIWNIRNVDNYRDTYSDTARQYTYRLTEICDEAWNCWNWTQDYNHNVYADTNHIWVYSVNSFHRLDLQDNNNIASDKLYPLSITLKDIYANAIIPSSWWWVWIDRTMDLNFNVTNTTNLDQYNRTWDSVFLDIPKTGFVWDYQNRLTNSSSFDILSSTGGTYTFNFQIYSPTFTWYTLADWDFTINSITYDINQSDPTPNPKKNFDIVNILNWWIYNDYIEFKFWPLYEASFSWQQKIYWFVEWSTQTWSINLVDNSWSISSTTSNNRLYLEFGSWSNHNVSQFFDMNINYNTENKIVWEWHFSWLIPSKRFWFLNSWTYDLLTYLYLTWGSVASVTNQYLSSHIYYDIAWKTVVYNSDIIWKNNYWWTLNNTTKTVWIKTTWKSTSTNYNQIISWQEWIDVKLIWDYNKSKISWEFKKSVYNLIKSIPISDKNTWTWYINNLTTDKWSNSDWYKISNDKVLYFWWLNWNIVTLWDWTEKVEWKKTIVIDWWNLYIRNNMYYANKTSDILWIIVLQDDNWNWWNVYINPSATNIVWTIFADKSILNYNWSNELDWYTDHTTLKNQLNIYGSLFVENTLWWSRKDPPVCPYYTRKTLTCDLKTAQKYDLNYLRRYFLYDSNWDGIITSADDPANWWISANSAYNANPAYKAYPVVIDYNPLIQIYQPPLFK